MADTLHSAPLLNLQRLAQGAHDRAVLALHTRQAQHIFRGGTAACDAAAAAIGFPLPTIPCSAATNGEAAALWLGPDEWLLLAPADHAAVQRVEFDNVLGSIPHSLVDVSHRNCALTLRGTDATLVLNAGCPLDFDLAAFPIGRCTRTILAKASVMVWRHAAQTFYVNTWRSLTPYVWDFLIEARTRL
jgi:sarcosine oxidase subunit gamma